MNTKKLIGTSMIALLVVALSVGMAAANPATVVIAADPIVNLLDGSTVTSTTVAIGDYNASKGPLRFLSVETQSSNLYIRVNGTINGTFVDTMWQSGARTGITYLADTAVDNTLDVYVYGTQPGNVNIADNDGNSYQTTISNDWAACTRPVNVPEFVTIAIPAIALLGLVLYMRRKKD